MNIIIAGTDYGIVLKKTADAGSYIGHFKDLPGVASFAKTKEKLRERLKDAFKCMEEFERLIFISR